MKQLLQNLRDRNTVIAEVPIPTLRPGTALVQTAVSLVSAGTERMVVKFAEKSLLGKARSRPDLVRQVLDKARREGLVSTIEATFNRLELPMALGYSSAGTITDVGEGLEGYKVGDRVACAGGGYAVHAEFAVVPQNLLTHLPAEVDFESAAFTTIGAIAMHGFRLAQPQLGERVAVIGLGLLGLISVGIARAAGCKVFGVDLDPKRVELGKIMGAHAVLRKDAESNGESFSQGEGFDSVLICADSSSNDPLELSGKLAGDRATVVAVGAVGMNIPRKVFFEKEINFLVSRSYGPGRYDTRYEESGQDYPIGYVRWTEGRNLAAFADLLGNGSLDISQLVTHRFPINQATQAYELITGKQDESFLGVLLTYPKQDAEQAGPTDGLPPTRVDNPHVEHPEGALGLGVLGAGNYASAVFLPAIQKVGGIPRIGIASSTGLSAQNASRRFNFKYASSSEEEILNDPNINVIAILDRHEHHARQVLEALQRGKHVYCEKPLAIRNEELEQITSALRESSKQVAPPLLTVGFNRRFAPMAIRLKNFLEGRSEPLIAHYRVNAGYLPLSHWLHNAHQGGGRIIGEGCHFIDFLTFLIGSPPTQVSAHSLPDGKRYRQDNVIMNFSFEDGSLGSVAYLANGAKNFPKERVEVFSEGRVALLDDFRMLELVQGDKRKVFRSRLRQDKGHRAAWKAFLDSISSSGPPPISYEHLIGVTRASFAVVNASNIGYLEAQSADD
jgi:predicted dehydrogenase/threonine dehydrogenase-like Zn-dependent dehydrogenase